MRFSVWPAPSRPWTEVRDLVQGCERAGWDGAYFPDHFMPNHSGTEPVDGPLLESWTVVASLAACTERLRLGTLVCGNLYRHPAVVANAAATLDHVSGGRFVLGVGAGWQENEHVAYGIELPPPKERLDRFEEACAVIRGLLHDQRTTVQGRYYRVTDAPCDPKPVQDPLPLLIGGRGERRTLRIAARYADEWNAWCTPEDLRRKSALLDRYGEEIGRDTTSVARSTQALVFLGADESTAAAIREHTRDRPLLVGSPAELVEQVAAYRDAGADELVVPDWTMGEVSQAADTLERFWTEVAVHFR